TRRRSAVGAGTPSDSGVARREGRQAEGGPHARVNAQAALTRQPSVGRSASCLHSTARRLREGEPMIAAIYARKSTGQTGADADAKSVARQIENARAFAKSKGWTVSEAHVYADDAVSGAETKRLIHRQRLLDLIATNKSPFQVLIMRDASRFSRRDGDEAF